MSQVGFTDDGIINGIVMDIYTDSGCHNNDQSADFALLFIDNGKCVVVTNLIYVTRAL